MRPGRLEPFLNLTLKMSLTPAEIMLNGLLDHG